MKLLVLIILFVCLKSYAVAPSSVFNYCTGCQDYTGTSVSSSSLPGGSTQYIQNTSNLQSGATFYVSSGTVSGQLSPTTIRWSDGTIQVSSPPVSGVSSGGGIVSPGTFTWTNTFGISVSTLNVQTSTSTAYESKFSTSSSMYHVAFSTNGHILSQGGIPVVSSCGSTPNGSVVGNDIAGVITVGGGISVTSCLLTFLNPYETNAPNCFTNDRTNALFTENTTTTGTMIVTATATFGGDTISYFCIGRQ